MESSAQVTQNPANRALPTEEAWLAALWERVHSVVNQLADQEEHLQNFAFLFPRIPQPACELPNNVALPVR